MDSDDSRGASSDNESTNKSNRSAGSRSRSGSRSVSPSSVSHKSEHSSRSNSSGNERSRSASSDSDVSEKGSRPQSPKSPTTIQSIDRNDVRSRSNSHSGSVERKSFPRDSESPKYANRTSVDRTEINSPTPNNYEEKNHRPRSPSPDNEDNERNLGQRSPANSENSSHSSSRGSSPTKKDSDRNSVKSESSISSKRSGRSSRTSGRSSKMSKSSKLSGMKKSDGNSSDSSSSSAESSSRKHISSNADVEPEEISEGDIESDEEKEKPKAFSKPPAEINISHEDLSDVSDLEDSLGHSDDEKVDNNDLISENQQNENDKRKIETEVPRITEKNNCKNETEEGEEQLDFEAEDGECGEVDDPKPKEDEKEKDIPAEPLEDGEMEGEVVEKVKETKKKEDLEEGEVSDEDEVRPEETEPRPVCRFFSRGQCTWGASCRFLHPGVTDKGNYTMFEMVHPLVPGEYSGGADRYATRPEPAPIESAWERGLRTAKEMLRKSIKRKEQDIDFEEKKMNLSLAQEEFDKENGYYGRVPSPEPRYVSRHPPVEYPAPARPPPEEYYNRRQVVYEPPEYSATRERVRPAYRELPTHKMPDYYNNKYEEENSGKRKPKREVIVHRAEREREREREERPSRADEWSDPWMRSKSPAGKRSGRKRSYSSGSSYSSSSSTRSTTSRSSYRSRSRSISRKRRRSPRSKKSRHVSPSVIVSERKAANERAAMMNPPAPRKRAPSPGMIRAVTAANPPAPADQFGRTRSKLVAALARARGKRRSSRSSSESSGSSSSDSESSGSSSSSSREGSPAPKRAGEISLAKAMDALKGNSAEKRQIKLNLKTPLNSRKPELAELARKVDQAQLKKRALNSPPPGDPKNKKAASRREELLKQLKAVEDAIAKKRSKVN